jgi:hypothetical protein
MGESICHHGQRVGKEYCISCDAETAPKCKEHGNPWACGWCGSATSNPSAFGGAAVAEPVRRIGDMTPSVTRGRIVFQNVTFGADIAKAEETWKKIQSMADEFCVGLASKPDPRAERERRRREIDAVLAEDARRFPAFATARRCAVMAAYEAQPNLHESAAHDMLTNLRGYEDARGVGRDPWVRAADPFVGWGRRGGTERAVEAAVASYERARGCK